MEYVLEKFHHGVGLFEEDYLWKVYWNEKAEGGPMERYYPPLYNVEDLMDRTKSITDRYTIVTWENET